MANLLTEYCQRHSIECAVPMSEGVCFFNNYANRPSAICLTGNSPKSISSCSNCPGSIIVELFVPHSGTGYSMVMHLHVDPDVNIINIVNGFGTKCRPFYVQSNGDVERWLWKFFMLTCRLRKSRSWAEWIKEHGGTSSLAIHEQMARCAIRYPQIYKTFYNMYQLFTAGRKYLLFK